MLEEVPFLRILDSRAQIPLGDMGIDLSLGVMADRERWTLLVVALGAGEPRMIRGAIPRFEAIRDGAARSYGLAAAPYISLRAAEVCKEGGIGFIDLAGNCRLVFDQIFIERRGFPKPRLEQRPLRTLFAPKASRVIRVLLEEPKRSWQVQELARQGKVSLGQAFKVKERLLDLDYARAEEEGLRVQRPEALLREWASVYSYQKNVLLDCYGSGEVADLERNFSDYCRANTLPFAFTLFSGAARVAPFARYSRGFAYMAGNVAEVAQRLGWKPVPSGANFTIMTPFDEGVFYGKREMDGETVASDVQLYLDLAGYKGRGEEAAEFLIEKKLRPRW